MESPTMTAPIASTVGVVPDKSIAKATGGEKFVVQFFSLLAVGFFLMYAYKTYLDVKLAKQQKLINEQELKLNEMLLIEQQQT